MTYDWYIHYHLKGDSNAEEIMMGKIARKLNLSEWDAFRFVYYYTMTYNIPSALRLLLKKGVKKEDLRFRTDRRWVRMLDRYERLLQGCTKDKLKKLKNITTTQQAYDEVNTWYFFSRYTTTLFLEVYCNTFRPTWVDDVKFLWERGENYAEGAKLLAQSNEKSELDKLLNRIRKDTKDNAFAIETSLCGMFKITKGKLYDGQDTLRMLHEADESEYRDLIYSCL